jgi:excinuclease ABC subunit A
VDLGPGAGELGGKVVFNGPFGDLLSDGNGSLTSRYLRGELEVVRGAEPRERKKKPGLKIFGATAHNLKNIDVEIPLGMMVVVTGVSGSGKSTLVHNVVYQSLRSVGQMTEEAVDEAATQLPVHQAACRKVEGAGLLEEVIMVDQSPIGRTPRSNPVTYIGAFDTIRAIFAGTAEAQRRGYQAGAFSFNVPGGRCETCQGDGTVKVEMQFLADVELICEDCKGTRYKSTILEIKYRDRNVHEVLQLTVDEAIEFFADQKKLTSKLQMLSSVGLGYLRLGQSATTLSGGEAQRVKLAGYLAQATCQRTLYIFDEPTTGLHFDDIAKLLAAFEKLIQNGGSLLIIEHNMDVIAAADWIIDLGPEGGARGGNVVGVGTPEQIASIPESYTGRFLKAHLQR